MIRFRLFLSWMIVAACTLPAWGAPGHSAIDAGSIATALSGMGVQILPEQVMLLTDVVASTSVPRLKVQSIEKRGKNPMLVRMECESPKECLPFFVSLRLSQSDESQLAGAFSARPMLSDSAPRPSLKSFVIRAGSPATLLLDGDRVHIKIPVICLENGASGQKIRVAGKDRRQFYSAEVIDGRLLKGRM